MRGIGRVVAAILLAGAVAGAAAFAHLLVSEPAPAPFGIAALPPAPSSPLIVQAAPWRPERPAVRVHVARPAARPAPLAPAPAAVQPIAGSRIQAPAAPGASLPATRAHVAPDPPAPATPPPAPQPAAPAPVAAPAPTPIPPDRSLATAAPVVAAVTAAGDPVASDERKHRGDHERHRGHGGHDTSGSDRCDGSGNAGDDSRPTVLSAPVLGAVLVDTTTPPPVETPPLPSLGPPPVAVTPADSGGHEHGRHEHGHGDRHDDTAGVGSD
jgi:hypothetical protein